MCTLYDLGLRTVLCEAEAILNSRPITKASTDPNDLEALTSNHLLLLKNYAITSTKMLSKQWPICSPQMEKSPIYVGFFWKRWTKEYLPQQQQRQKWCNPKQDLIPGDIQEISQDKKGFVRHLRIKTRTGFLNRAINKVCLWYETENIKPAGLTAFFKWLAQVIYGLLNSQINLGDMGNSIGECGTE